jgi:hypothetical protein
VIGDVTAAEAREGLRQLPLAGTYSTGDDGLRRFYLPALAAASNYDRMAGYYSSSVLRVTAPGLRRFLRNAQEHGGRMRLIVGAQLSEDDVAMVREGVRSRSEAIGQAARSAPIELDGHPAGDEYLKLLGWMVSEGLLDVKVGVPLDASGVPLAPDEAMGYFHSKYGLLTDPFGDRVAFLGSENETAAGWLHNHETFTVAKSWMDQVWAEQGAPISARFEAHWHDRPDQGWAVLPLSEVDDRLLKLVPQGYFPPEHDPIWQVLGVPDPDQQQESEPELPVVTDLDAAQVESAWAELVQLAQRPVREPFTGALTAPVAPLPHQARLVHRAVSTFPRGYLFADPVGFGKTVEVGLTLRELMLAGTISRALILVPASVLKQWQEELAEKIGLVVPRYDGRQFLDIHDQPVQQPASTNPWSAFPIVLASSHLARRRARRDEVLAGGPWDVVVVDEAHHARRQGSKPTDTANALLTLLQAMRRNESWRALYLATATPMQMNPHEAWDLIELLDLPGKWGRSAEDFLSYYRHLRQDPEGRSWSVLQRMLDDYFTDSAAPRDSALEAQIKAQLGAVKARKITRLNSDGISDEAAKNLSPVEASFMDAWLRHHTPMKDRVFRNTRDTLRAYQAAGIIPPDVVIPERHVSDEFIVLDEWEQQLYDRIEQYIRRYYNAYISNSQTQALGFIMTIYRRRLTSSFYAIRQSLKRRLLALEQGLTLGDLLSDDDRAALEEDTLFDVDTESVRLDLLKSEIDELRKFVADLEAITGQDTKATRLVDDLAAALGTYSSVVVFTQYTDTMDYVRQRLVLAGYDQIGCYSGRGGELWNGHEWQATTKEDIKTRFREGQLHVLIGTDSMSEGLNLQTSGRLFNYDMPWNLMRVEQRIGRVDRIGATYLDIQVSNYFYAGTVEETVYKGIAADYGDFTDIIGSAQPVLGSIEQAIEKLALQADGGRDEQAAKAQEAVQHLKDEIDSVNHQAVLIDDLGDRPQDLSAEALQLPDEVTDHGQSQQLAQVLLANPLTAPLFSEAKPGIYRFIPPKKVPELSLTHDHPGSPKALLSLAADVSPIEVTFDRSIAAELGGVNYLTYGEPALDSLLPAPAPETDQSIDDD